MKIDWNKVEEGYSLMQTLEKENKQLKEEMERLKKENAILKQTMCDESLLINENSLLKDIIKEVREYIEENFNSNSSTTLTSGKTTDVEYCLVAFEDILEILEKVNI